MLSSHLIERYRELYRKHYGINISAERAEEEGLGLANLLDILLKYSNIEELESSEDTV